MAIDIVRDADAYAPLKTARLHWVLRRKISPRRWAPDLGSGVYVREARTQSGMLCFRVVFPDGKHFHSMTLAEAQAYAEGHSKG